jgi:tetratricopeptide (TPR) repeat protein
MSESAVFADAVALIRAGQTDQAVNLLQAAIPDLPPDQHRKAHSYTGLACYFAERWAEALSFFTIAARDSEIPEDHFNQAMAQVKLGDVEGAHASWQKVFDLSYAHQDAPETSSFFQKKLMFARLLKEAGKCDGRGLDLLERQLMGFYTNYHITDASYWGIRKVPAFEDVLDLTRDYYRAMGRSQEEWNKLLDSIAPEIDDDGRAFMETLRSLK